MRIFLGGVACVGKSTIGECLAKRLGFIFYDLDKEVEKHFGKPLERLRAQTFSTRRFRKQYEAAVLTKLIGAEPNRSFVMELPPSGLQDVIWDAIKQVERVVVVIHDSPENILSRICFYDDDSNLLPTTLDDEQLEAHLEEIKKDIAYYRRSFSKADMAVHINGLDAAQSAEKIDLALRDWLSFLQSGPHTR